MYFKQLIFLALISINTHAQFQFSYLYEFKKDSLNKNTYTEITSVIADGDFRFYRSENEIIKDSIGYTNRVVNGNNISSFLKETLDYNSKLENFTIEIDLDNNIEKSYIYNMETPALITKKLEPLKWNIEQETIEIEGKKVRKATTYHMSRNWIAYFSEDLPLQIAPYNFYGLPGTIVKLEDEFKNYKFELLNYKQKDNFENFYKTTLIKRREKIFVDMSPNEVYDFGKYLQKNSIRILVDSGYSLTEEEIIKREKRNEQRKYIYLNPLVPFLL